MKFNNANFAAITMTTLLLFGVTLHSSFGYADVPPAAAAASEIPEIVGDPIVVTAHNSNQAANDEATHLAVSLLAQIRSTHDLNKIGLRMYDFIDATAPLRKNCGCVIVIDPAVQNDFSNRMKPYDSLYSGGHFPKTLSDFANDRSLFPMPDTRRGDCDTAANGCNDMVDNNNYNPLNPGAYKRED